MAFQPYAIPNLSDASIYFGLTVRLGVEELVSIPIALIAITVQGYFMVNPKEVIIGGNTLLTRSQALAAARRKLREDYPNDVGNGFPLWDTIEIPREYTNKGFFIMGESGSGKTVYLKYLMHEAFQQPGVKGVIHDFKMDIHPFLKTIPGINASEIKLLHSYDKRSVGIDLQRDLEDEDNAEELAGALVLNDGKDPFFPKSAQNIVKAGLCYLLYRSEENCEFRWGLKSLIDLMDKGRMLEAIRQYPRLAYAKDALENESVRATIFTDIGKLGTVAEMWAEPGRELISLYDWRRKKDREILILGTDEKKGTVCRLINRIIWTQLYKEVIDQEFSPHSDTWFFLDEFHLLSALPGIERFANVARSRRGNLVIAAQDFNQVVDIYGKEKTNIILQGCANQIYFRCSGNAARFAAEQIGAQKLLRKEGGMNTNQQGVSLSENDRHVQETVVMAEDIRRLKKCTPQRPTLDAILITFMDDPFHYEMDFENFRHVWPSPEIMPDYQPASRRKRMDPAESSSTNENGSVSSEVKKTNKGFDFETGSDLPYLNNLKTRKDFDNYEDFAKSVKSEICTRTALGHVKPKVKHPSILDKDIN